MKSRQWHLPYTLLLFSIFIATSCLYSFQSYALDWIIVTSEADSGPGTLREAINLANASGSEETNAIAFSNNIQAIQLQSNLPAITAPLLIDGFAIIGNGTVIQEGDCSMLPSPKNNPQGFSAGIRITIDGSIVSDFISPSNRWGLKSNSNTTIRGIRIKNITALTDGGSLSAGIIIAENNTQNIIECCEIDQIRNTGKTSNIFSIDGNRAVGVESLFKNNNTTISKCYIHNIEGGSIFEKGPIAQSGSAYGILNCPNVNSNRIECIVSGSVNLSTGNTSRQAFVGRAIGITFTINEADLPSTWPCDTPEHKTETDNCQIECNQACTEPVCIQHNLIININGGSVITDQFEVFLTETAGILLGSPFNEFTDTLNQNALIQNNTIHSVHSGNITTSRTNEISIALGSFGIIINTPTSVERIKIQCNCINSILTGSTTIEGNNSIAFPGYTHGIWSQTNRNTSINTALIEHNTLTHICGASATATGACSIITDNLEEICNNSEPGRNTPGGLMCTGRQRPTVAGIHNVMVRNIIASNNSIEKINGGKRTAQGLQSSVHAFETAGIYIESNTSTVHQNSIQSIIGAKLIAKPGSLGAIKERGTTGLSVNADRTIISENKITLVCEGQIKAASSSLGANLTTISFGLIDEPNIFRAKQLEIDTALPYAPVITSGIAIASISIPPSILSRQNRSCTNQDQWCITDNTVSTIIGSTVAKGIQPLGSIATGIWMQPVTRTDLSCAYARQTGIKGGTTYNNTVNNITGGTNAPAYGIFLDGSGQFFDALIPNESKEKTFFTVDKNNITTVYGSKKLPVFNVNLSVLREFCPGSMSDDLNRTAFPFLPFEPTSGIYTLFGGCSTLQKNTITDIKAFKTEARGITTAASSDMLITDNSCSQIKGYGIFVGGVIATIDVADDLGTNPNELTLEKFASVRNKIHTNSTFDNTNKGIKLGLVDWSNALFGLEKLNICNRNSGPIVVLPFQYNAEIIPEDSVAIFGNHGQQDPSITNIICNSSGKITIDISLKNTHRLTNFTIQFFKNSTSAIPHGEQAISNFDDQYFLFATDFYGNAHKRFTFNPLAKIEAGDTITAHVTINDLGQAAVSDIYLCDTSEFGSKRAVPCIPKVFTQKQTNKPSSTDGLATVFNR